MTQLTVASRSRPDRPRVLVLAHRFPFPPNKGDRIRVYHVLRLLSRRAEVDLLTLADEPVEPSSIAQLERLGLSCRVAPLGRTRWLRAILGALRGRSLTQGLFDSPKLWALLHRRLEDANYDAVLAFCSSMLPYAHAAAAPGRPVAVDFIDVDSRKWRDYADAAHGWRRWAYRREARTVEALELEALRRCDQITVVSDDELRCLREVSAEGSAASAANGVDAEHFSPSNAAEPEAPACVFVGALDYAPNVDAACWFCEEIWPAVRRQFPDRRFAIVGRRPTAAVRRLANLPGVAVHADVAEVRTYLRPGSVAVAPLRIARGVQNKVLEAMACGLPTIVSPQALTGLAAIPGEHVWLAASADDWRAATIRLLTDEPLRRRLGLAARQYVLERHDWQACLQPLLDAVAPPGSSANRAGDVPFDAEDGLTAVLAGVADNSSGSRG